MSSLRSAALRVASELPKGDPTRRKLLAMLREAGGLAYAEDLGGSFFHDLLHKDAYRRARQYIKKYNRKAPPEEQIEAGDLFMTTVKPTRHGITYNFQDGAYSAFSVIYEIDVTARIYHG